MRPKLLIFVLFCVIACVASLSAFRFSGRTARSAVSAQERVSRHPVEPYFATFDEVVQRVGEAAKTSSRRTVAVRSDGAKVEKMEVLGTYPLTRREVYLPNGVEVTIQETFRLVLARQTNLWNPTSATRLDPESSCQATFDGVQEHRSMGPDETIQGLRAVHVTGVSKSAWEHWFLPDVECAEAKRLAVFKGTNGVVTDTSELVATDFKRQEPPASLFEIPRDYLEVPPSEITKRHAAYIHHTMADVEVNFLATVDAQYQKNKVSVKSLTY